MDIQESASLEELMGCVRQVVSNSCDGTKSVGPRSQMLLLSQSFQVWSTLDGVGGVGVTNQCGLVVWVIVDLKLEWLALCRRLNQSSGK